MKENFPLKTTDQPCLSRLIVSKKMLIQNMFQSLKIKNMQDNITF